MRNPWSILVSLVLGLAAASSASAGQYEVHVFQKNGTTLISTTKLTLTLTYSDSTNCTSATFTTTTGKFAFKDTPCGGTNSDFTISFSISGAGLTPVTVPGVNGKGGTLAAPQIISVIMK